MDVLRYPGYTPKWMYADIPDTHLKGCTQMFPSVSVGGNILAPLLVNIGVLQGSILGPLLSLPALNDIPLVTQSCLANMFADATEIGHACKPAQYTVSLRIH